MYAIIQARGRQIRVSPGAVIEVDGTAGEQGKEFTFEQVLLVEKDAGDIIAGAPFVAANASRLQRIAWALLALQLLGLVIGAIAKALSTPAHPIHVDAGFSVNGWLAVLLTFVLARVFAEGALMREDLEGTV